MLEKKSLLHFVIQPDLLKSIDDWRYRNQFPTRASAIIWLINFALKQKPKADLA